MTTYTYEFNAFTEEALLSAGSGNGTNLGYGDTFTMPATSDTTFIVTDNDAYLSGDSWNNENANDSSYQTAEIIVDGEEAGNGGQIYGEQYYWVWGSSGQWYLMIEVEQEGTGDDYFTFYNAYGMPQEGETLTVQCGGNIDYWQPHMGCLESPASTTPPVAVLDAITITEGESIGDSSDDAQLNILANDFDTDGTITLTGVNGASPGDVVTVTTERGLTVEVTVDANGNLFFDTGSDFDSLRVGESDSFELTYTITDNDGNQATSTVTVTIEGETTVDAADDVITVLESEGAGDLETLDSGADSVLVNDTIDGETYDGLVVTVNGQTGNVGQWIDLEKGRVKLNADGTIDFDADGDFDALNDGESEAVTLNYTISAVDAGPDEYQCLFFNNLATGEIVTDQFADAGLTISSANPNNPVMIFDSANPTGGDFDLATSNLGKVLILSEDGNSANPDDNAGGGTFIFEFDRAADIDSITMLDTEEPAPQIRLYGEDGMLLNTITGPVTADGGQGVAQINTTGVFRMEIELQGSGALDNLIYTIEGPTTVVDQDAATVTINVIGESDADGNLPPDAVDDFFSTVETTPITGNVLDNDSDPDGDAISVIAVEGGEVGGQIAVTTAKGNTGFVTVGADGAFSFTPDDNFASLAEGETDSFDLTYTITDDPSTAAKTNLLFVLDVSNSTVGLDGQNVFDGVGVGDVNGDGRADTVLDAEIQAVISSVNKLLAQGIDPSMVDLGLVTFSGLVDLSRFAAPFNTPDANAETIGGDGTVYQLDSAALIPALQSILSGGWTNYEAGLQEAEGWLAANADSGEANKVIFLSDGRPIIDYVNGAYVSQDNSDYGDEVTRIVNNYNADIAAIGVGANSSLEALDDLDNTGGAEQVLDVETLTVAVEDAVLLPLTDTATITVTINGLNDLADGDEIAEVAEGSGLTALPDNALANTVDPDGGSPIVESVEGVALNGGGTTLAGSAGGTFTFNADGSVSFDTNGEFAYLSEGQEVVSAVTYEVSDGQGGLVTSTYSVVVRGTEGEPIIDALDDFYVVNEDETFGDTEGNVLDNDDLPFAGENLVVEVNGVSGNVGQWIDLPGGGRVKLDANGEIDFDANGAYDSLSVGDSAFENLTYTVRSTDDTQDSVVAVFEGPNGLAATAEIVELNGELVVTLTVQGGGGDIGDIRGFFFDVSDESLLGGMSATGADITDQEFEANNVFNLGGGNNVNGDIVIELGKFDGGVTAGTQGIGTDDIRSTTFTLSHGSQALGLDLLLNQDMALRLTSVGEEGGSRGDSLKLDSVGLPNTADSLVDTATVQIEIQGLNELADGDEAAGVEEGSGATVLAVNALDNTVDIDEGSVPVVTAFTGVTGSNGGLFSIDAAGQITFDTNGDFSFLAEGETAVTSVNYTVTDGQGGEVQSSVTITVNGVNSLDDGDEAAEVDEGSGVTILAVNALDNTVDPDGGTPAVTPIAGVAGSNGGLFSIDAAGQITFDTNDDFDFLAEGETATTTVTYTVTDGQGGEVQSSVTITVNGVNDLADGDEAAEVDEGSGVTVLAVNALDNTVDPDNGSNPAVTPIAGVAGSNGGLFSIDAAGQITFDTNDDFNTLGAGDTATTTVTYTVTDGQGGEVQSNVTITVNGVNDLEDGDETASVFEDAAPTQLDNALLNTVDPDSDPAGIKIATLAGAALVAGAATADGSSGGSFTFLEDGSVTFATNGDFDFLTPGQMTTTSVSYQVTDGDGGLVTSTYTVEVTGVNDAPVAVANSYVIDEGTALTGANIITDPDQSSDAGEVDSDPNGDALSINSALGKDVNGDLTVDIVSTSFVTVYTDGGVAVEVRLDDAGNLEVSENSDVGPDGDQISLVYTVEDAPANGDVKVSNQANVTVAINDVPEPGGPEVNVVFLLDASDLAVSANSSALAVGDLNGDGKANSIFDASIVALEDMVTELNGSLGVNPADVDVGVFSFESQVTSTPNEFTPAVGLQDGGQTVFDLSTPFSSVIADVLVNTGTPFGDNGSDAVDNGAAFMAAAIEAANGFISANDQSAASGGESINLVYVIGGSLGADIGNDYIGATGPGTDGIADGFLPVEYLENLPDPTGQAFRDANLDPNSDVALTEALLEAQTLDVTLDTLYFGSDSIAFNSGLFALENFAPDANGELLSDGVINTTIDDLLGTVTGTVGGLLDDLLG